MQMRYLLNIINVISWLTNQLSKFDLLEFKKLNNIKFDVIIDDELHDIKINYFIPEKIFGL